MDDDKPGKSNGPDKQADVVIKIELTQISIT